MRKKILCGFNATQLFFILLLFIYIYDPPFIRQSCQKLMDILAAVWLLCSALKDKSIVFHKKIFRPAAAFIPFLLYITVMAGLHCMEDGRNSTVYLEEYFLMVKFYLRTVIICAFVHRYRLSGKISEEQYLRVLLATAWMQIFFVILTMAAPGIRMMIMSKVADRASGNLAFIASSEYVMSFRSFGLAGNHFYSFGYVLALSGTLAFVMSVNCRKRKYFILTVALFIATIFNSRTGVVLLAAAVLTAVLYFSHSICKISTIIEYSILSCAAGVFIIFILRGIYPATFDWLLTGMKEIFALLTEGKRNGTFLVSRGTASIPENLVTGMGGAPEYFSAGYCDNGYLICLWRFGLAGTLLLLAAYAYLFYQSFTKGHNECVKVFSLCICIMFYLYLYKIFSIGNMGGNLIIFSLITINETSRNSFRQECRCLRKIPCICEIKKGRIL